MRITPDGDGEVLHFSKEIKAKELPELDDEFAAEVSEFDTLAEYKEDVKKNLIAKNESEEYSSDVVMLEWNNVIEGINNA